VRLEHAPHTGGPRPLALRAQDIDPPSEQRTIEDERLEFAPFPARMDASCGLQPKEVFDRPFVPPSPEPARIEALRRHTGEDDLEPRAEIVTDQLTWIVTPERSEDP